MEEGPWEAHIITASTAIPRIVWNPRVHHCLRNSPPFAPVRSQMNLIHAFPFISVRCVLILSAHLRPRLLYCLLRLSFQTKLCMHLLSPPYVTHAPPVSCFTSWWCKNFRWRLQITEIRTMEISPVSNHFLPLGPKYPPQHSRLENPNPHFSVMWETTFHTCVVQESNLNVNNFGCRNICIFPRSWYSLYVSFRVWFCCVLLLSLIGHAVTSAPANPCSLNHGVL